MSHLSLVQQTGNARGGQREAELYLMVCKADIAREEHGEPVAPRGHIHGFGQLLQNLEMTGLEVVRQSDVELFFMRLNVNI